MKPPTRRKAYRAAGAGLLSSYQPPTRRKTELTEWVREYETYQPPTRRKTAWGASRHRARVLPAAYTAGNTFFTVRYCVRHLPAAYTAENRSSEPNFERAINDLQKHCQKACDFSRWMNGWRALRDTCLDGLAHLCKIRYLCLQSCARRRPAWSPC